ncbi:MAG: hypothetical protein KJ697_04060 [Nanoarchaeota archaeon]|nr:hypothetical protein [Nanoarchaeota archaeon]MBU4123904.1 hypothetical protein [Nanoarchaeota archaeon]
MIDSDEMLNKSLVPLPLLLFFLHLFFIEKTNLNFIFLIVAALSVLLALIIMEEAVILKNGRYIKASKIKKYSLRKRIIIIILLIIYPVASIVGIPVYKLQLLFADEYAFSFYLFVVILLLKNIVTRAIPAIPVFKKIMKSPKRRI